MTDQLYRLGAADGGFRNGPHQRGDGRPRRPKAAPSSVPVAHSPATEEWVNEGGTPAIADDAAASLNQEARDTPVGCRERAVQDLSQAAASSTENSRMKFERSAANWVIRAELIERTRISSASQKSADLALWAKEEILFPTGPGTDQEEGDHVRL
jgi:hypothetical protein